MTIDKRAEHAPYSPSANSESTPAIMPSQNAWIMDDPTRNKLLKKYKTQVASGVSTVCATLSVVCVIFRSVELDSFTVSGLYRLIYGGC